MLFNDERFWNIQMSTIHKALKKAQREKDHQFQEYEGVLSGGEKRTGRRSKALLWIIPALVITGFLSFTAVSWFDSEDAEKQPPLAAVQQKKKPEQAPAVKKNVAKPAKKKMTEAIDKGKIKTLLVEAKEFQKTGRFENARQTYQEILNKNPGHTEAMNNLGVLYMHEKNYSAAKIQFNKTIHLQPEAVDPHYNLACVYALTGLLEQSMDHLKKAYTLNPDVIKWAQQDSDLSDLKRIPEFESLLGK